MKILIAVFSLFICSCGISQEKGQPFIFKRFGHLYIHPLATVTDTLPYAIGKQWTIVGEYKIRPWDKDFLLVSDTGDSSHIKMEIMKEVLAKRLCLMPSEFNAIKTNYPKDKFDLLMTGNLWIGMTEADAVISWGIPDNINTTKTATSTEAQYVYSSRYLYFKDGRLKTIQY